MSGCEPEWVPGTFFISITLAYDVNETENVKGVPLVYSIAF
jgi:hypothetical protein